MMRPVSLLEAVLYADDLAAAEAFYSTTLGLELHSRQTGRHVFFRCGQGMFLVFNPTATNDPALPTGAMPFLPHGSHGPGHVAFRIPASTFAAWRSRLQQARIPIEAEVDWPAGGQSLYFRDPAGNSVELATGALWSLPEAAPSTGAGPG